ncbi:MAG: hypothetical protein WA823_15195 [Candidatus Acidiferrales bacterium]
MARTLLVRVIGFAAAAALASAAVQAPVLASAAPQDTPAQQGAPQEPTMQADTSTKVLESGFQHLYELKFDEARTDFFAYQKARPDDPMGKAAESASYLFEQFNQKGVLTSEFFLSDEKFLGGVDGSAAQNKNERFLQANDAARLMAKSRLKTDPRNIRALLVLTMTDGMESDYDALIIKNQLAGLHMMKQAEAEANTLLAIDNTMQDANVALGMSNYVIGCLPSYKRAFLFFGGMHGDRVRGMQQMASAAERGHYFKPFAEVMLALAYEREHDNGNAQKWLAQLASTYPENPVFTRELEIVNKKIAKA